MISSFAPGDPVEIMLNQSTGDASIESKERQNLAYNELRHQLGFDLPLFYFSVTTKSACDTLYKINSAAAREDLDALCYMYGNANDVMLYYQAVLQFKNTVVAQLRIDTTVKKEATHLLQAFSQFKNLDTTHLLINKGNNQSIYLAFNHLKKTYRSMIVNANTYNKYIPSFNWYGSNNQFHRWLFGTAKWFSAAADVNASKGFVRGDFGLSYQDKRPVALAIKEALPWTFYLSIISAVLAYIIAIPIGVSGAVNNGTAKDKWMSTIVFMLYSLPPFWIATLLVVFLCGGDWLALFPSPAADFPDADAPFLEKVITYSYRMILPLFCWTYGSIAFISRQMRTGMLTVLNYDFIRTAKAKGLEKKSIIWTHAFKNALIPIITLFAGIFPAIISGSFIIEYIFSIPGMGKLSLDAIVARNYPVVFTVMMFAAILTLVGNLIADILYAWADPRISFENKK